jgi:PAS domain S-box-containing protein
MRGEPAPQRYELRLLASDGKAVWVEMSSAAIEWEERPASLYVFMNITERKNGGV